uniref:choice-of-anchor A family protein n=1 Tax=uncultured Polaribacter sp. TaxID=174711 RepID=UPI00263847EF
MKSRITYLLFFVSILIANNLFGSNKLESKENIIENTNNCGISKNHAGGCWNTEITSVIENNGKFDIEILVTYVGQGGGRNGCKELSHFSIDVPDNTYSIIGWTPVSGNPTGNMVSGTGNNDPFNKRGFKLDNVSGIGGSSQGSFKISYTLDKLQDQQFLAKAGNDYSQIAIFEAKDFGDVKDCITPPCETADNTTSTASITENETKTLTGTPAGGTFSIVSGGGSITNGVYTPDNINTNTDVTIKYTIAADGSCAETSEDITFTVTPVCDVVADNTTSIATILENETKTLTGAPAGGTFTIVSGGGTINNGVYTPDNINTNTDVTIRYTVAADGDCAATSEDITFTVTPVCDVVADNTTSTASITENETKTLTGAPAGGTFTIVSGGGSINNGVYTPDNINTDTTVIIRYTIAADGDCAATSDEITFSVTSICTNPINTVPGNLTTQEDTELSIQNISVSDDDDEIKDLRLRVSNGTLKVVVRISSGRNPVTVNGPGDITITGTARVINSHLSTLTYTPNPGFYGIDTLIMTSTNTCFLTDVDSFNITVTQNCEIADNTTSTASITENETKTLTGAPAGGTWSIVSGGGGLINGNIYTPDDITTNTTVVIRYTVAANGSCGATSDDVTFIVEADINCSQFNPTNPANGFNVFTLNDLTLTTNETEGAIATGGNLTIAGNYQITTNDPGTFTVNNVPVGLVVGGRVIYQNGNSLQINQNTYVKIGESNGSVVWYQDQNNAFAPIRITKNSSYNSSPRIMMQASSNQLNVSSTNNPVFQQNVVDFASAFQNLQTNSTALSQKSNNAQLTNPNGQSISNTNLPNQVKINLQNGINYLNITGSDLNNVNVFTYNNKPSASRVLIINVDASGTFNWDVWNQAGVGQQDAPYVLYNFYNTTTLNIEGNSTVVGSILAPFADINKTVNQSNLEGQVIGKSFVHAGGEVHSANFNANIDFCTTQNGESPTSSFNFTGDNCLNSNSFTFTNTSSTTNSQPNYPITYLWDFGDGTTSTDMNPTKTYSNSGTYNVTLTATNSFGTDIVTQQVEVLAPISAPVISSTSTNNGNGTVTYEFTLDNTNSFDTWSWEIPGQGTGLFVDQNSISVDYTTVGSFNVTVTGTKNSCSQSESISINITSGEVTGGNSGGVESESLGDAISKI